MQIIQRRIGSPPRTWCTSAQLIAQAHERLHGNAGVHDLVSIGTTFQASPRQLGVLFGVTRQAIEQWLVAGVPASRRADLGRVADVARRLRRTFKRERISVIVRQGNPGLAGESVLAALAVPGGANRTRRARALQRMPTRRTSAASRHCPLFPRATRNS